MSIAESRKFQLACEVLSENGMALADGAVQRLDQHLELLQSLGPSFGVISKTDAERGLDRHLVDCMSVLTALGPVDGVARLVDVGSGGGLPGLVLASCVSNVDVSLLERSAKKCAFLTRCVGELGLARVTVEPHEFGSFGWGIAPVVTTVRAIEKAQAVVPALLDLLPEGSRCLWLTGSKVDLALPPGFHVEQIVDKWSALGLRRGALFRISV